MKLWYPFPKVTIHSELLVREIRNRLVKELARPLSHEKREFPVRLGWDLHACLHDNVFIAGRRHNEKKGGGGIKAELLKEGKGTAIAIHFYWGQYNTLFFVMLCFISISILFCGPSTAPTAIWVILSIFILLFIYSYSYSIRNRFLNGVCELAEVDFSKNDYEIVVQKNGDSNR